MTALLNNMQAWWDENLNPILSREIRQSIRSNIHIWTFIVMIYICFIVTTIYVIAGGGSGYEEGTISYGTGDELFGGLFLVLSLISLIGIPMTVFLSHVYEREQDCLDLLKVTTLSPGQIVRGKLLAAFSKLLLFLSALIPFFAFAYILRGISFPAILSMVIVITMITILMTMVYLYFSMLVNHGASKITILIFLIILSFFTIGYAIAIAFDTSSISSFYWSTARQNLIGIASLLGVWGSLIFFLHESSRSLIMNPSENRARPVRMSALVLIAISLGIPIIMATENMISYYDYNDGGYALVWILAIVLCFLWSTEFRGIPRRTLHDYRNKSWPVKLINRFFLPGRDFGVQFSFVVIALCTLGNFAVWYVFSHTPGASTSRIGNFPLTEESQIQLITGGYLFMYMGLAYHVTNLLREFFPVLSKRQTRGITLISLIVLMIAPYMLGLLLIPEMLERSFTILEFFNPAVVISEMMSPKSYSVLPYVAIATLIGFGLLLPAIFRSQMELNENQS